LKLIGIISFIPLQEEFELPIIFSQSLNDLLNQIKKTSKQINIDLFTKKKVKSFNNLNIFLKHS
jgi:hypothetical protein